jgi:CubicO group peptidase (beta-lactamase class C family)
MPDFGAARDVVREAIARRVFPGAVVEVGSPTRPVWQEACGALTYDPGAEPAALDSVYDLASLTKVIATAGIAMRQVEQGVLALDDAVAAHVPAWRGDDRRLVTLRDLLSHCAGLPDHRPFYRHAAGVEAFTQLICDLPLEYVPRSRSIYSDLGFILLGRILASGASLEEGFAALWARAGAGEEMQFHPPPLWRRRTAPTEMDSWRGRLLVGEVHDENCFALGGAAGHAGLFGTASAVGAFARHVLQVMDGRSGAFSTASIAEFTARRAEVPLSSRALAWDTMLPTSSCGTRMSARAIGHTGYTGTSLWLDPAVGCYVVLLTNRVHPTRAGDGISQVRPAFHDAVMDALASDPGWV